MASPIVTQSAIKGDVPGYLAKPIGHIIVKWAFLEYCLSRLIWELVGVEPQVGRVAISSPRAHEKLDNIRELLFLKRKVMMDDRIFNALRSRIIEANGLRDNLCHGQWANDDRGWAIISTRGFVTDQTIERIERSRKFRPERMSVTVASLTPIFARINELVSAVESIRETAASPEKLRKQPLRRQLRRTGDKSAKPQPPAQSSEG